MAGEQELGGSRHIPWTRRIAPSLALFRRGALQDSRGWLGNGLRMILLCALILVFSGPESGSGADSAMGGLILGRMMMINSVLVFVAGLSFLATSISEERDLETLGLLRLTGAGPLGLILGKWGARLWFLISIQLIQLPFLVFTVSLGGVKLSQVLDLSWNLLAFTLSVGGISALASSLAKSSRQAVIIATLLLTTIFLSFIIALIALSVIGFRISADSFLERFGIHQAFLIPGFRAFDEFGNLNTPSGVAPRFIFPIVNVVIGFISLRLTLRSLIKFEDGIGFDWLWRWNSLDRFQRSRGASGESPGLLKNRPWSHALRWKDFVYSGGGTRWLWRRAILVGCFSLYVLIFTGEGESYSNWGAWRSGTRIIGDFVVAGSTRFALFKILFWVLVIDLAVMAGRIYSQEMVSQTLSTLAMLPLSRAALWREKWLGCLLSASPQVIVMSFAFLSGFGEITSDLFKRTENFYFFGMCLTIAVVFIQLTAWLSLMIPWGAVILAGLALFVVGLGVSYSPILLLTLIFLILTGLAIYFREELPWAQIFQIDGAETRSAETSPLGRWFQWLVFIAFSIFLIEQGISRGQNFSIFAIGSIVGESTGTMVFSLIAVIFILLCYRVLRIKATMGVALQITGLLIWFVITVSWDMAFGSNSGGYYGGRYVREVGIREWMLLGGLIYASVLMHVDIHRRLNNVIALG